MKALFLIMVWITATAAAATNFYAIATVTETNVFLGQVFTLDVVVKADTQPAAPDPAGLTGFYAVLLEDGQPTSQTNAWLYRYALRPVHDGELQIPPMRFGSLYTKALAIKAAKPEQTDRMRLDVQLSKPAVYQGEPVLLTTTWDSTYPFGAIKAVDFHCPVFNDERFQILELHDPDREKRPDTTGLPVHGTRVLATRRSYQLEDVQHQSLSFSKLLIPETGGTITIRPFTLLCAAEEESDPANPKKRRSAFQYPSYFDNTFFDQNVAGSAWTRIYTESAPVVLEVKPLPDEGRPDLFNGMVGEYAIHVDAEPTTVHVGEPVTLTITVTASNYMESISLGPLRDQPLLADRFEIPSERSLPRLEGKSKIYTQTIRPLSTLSSEIPPLRLVHFSPAAETYVTAESLPIPLTVLPAEEIGFSGAGTYPRSLHSVEGGIRHNYEKPDMLQNRRPLLFGTRLAVALAILLIPPLTAGGISLFSLVGRRRHHIYRTAKAARAYKVFRKNAAHIVLSHSMKSEIYRDLDRVLRAYLGDRLHLTPGALSFRDAAVRLRESGTDSDTLAELQQLFELCEAYRFTRGYDEKADAKQIVRNAARIVKAVERKLK